MDIYFKILDEVPTYGRYTSYEIIKLLYSFTFGAIMMMQLVFKFPNNQEFPKV